MMEEIRREEKERGVGGGEGGRKSCARKKSFMGRFWAPRFAELRTPNSRLLTKLSPRCQTEFPMILLLSLRLAFAIGPLY